MTEPPSNQGERAGPFPTGSSRKSDTRSMPRVGPSHFISGGPSLNPPLNVIALGGIGLYSGIGKNHLHGNNDSVPYTMLKGVSPVGFLG